MEVAADRISIDIDKTERSALNALRRKLDDCRAERALAVLHCADGLSASRICKILGRNVHTVGRVLDPNGYSFTRGKLTAPASAPSKEEKLARVQQIASEMLALKAKGDVEVMFLDESHFSTEPYVTRGYRKRGKPFFPPDSEKKGKLHDILGIRAGKRRFLLEKL